MDETMQKLENNDTYLCNELSRVEKELTILLEEKEALIWRVRKNREKMAEHKMRELKADLVGREYHG